MWIKSTALSCAIGLGAAAAETAPLDPNAPRSAIDWLTAPAPTAPVVIEPAVSAGGERSRIETTPLGAPTRGGVGLLGSEITGLPVDTFANARPERLITLIKDMRPSDLPALQSLSLLLLLAELTPPFMPDGGDAYLNARVDRLVAFGALDQAQALLEQAGPKRRTLFEQWFNISLLTGHDERACMALRGAPDLSADMSARAFCLSRGGDWAAAALTLETGRVLGAISEDDADLLARFLDPEAFEDSLLPPNPQRGPMTPLRFRLLAGLGEPPETQTLPLAYAISDLSETIGWKAQIEAAERLARAQAIAPERLRGLYLARRPAASGGVWDRAIAFQAFETALETGDPGAIANALPEIWAEMSRAGLQVPFAQLYGAQLAEVPLAPAAGQLAFKVGLLSKGYASVASSSMTSALPRDAFAKAIATGTIGEPRGLGPVAAAIAEGFQMTQAPAPFDALVAGDRLGEALLLGIAMLQDGAQSDPGDIAAMLALLRTQGLEDVAIRTALQLLLMDRPT